MKISHFPDFLPDETVFSVGSRYFDRMQFRSHSIVSQHFFGKHTKGVVTDFPSNLQHLVKALPFHNMYTTDIIIDRHTLFPFYAPFLSFERALTLRTRMKIGGTSLHSIGGVIKGGVLRPRWLKFCPACVDYDRWTYGECYWHRIHQVPGVLVCPIHEIMLENSQVNMLLGDHFVQYRSAEDSVSNLPQRMISAPLRAALVQLARNAKWLLEHSVSVERGYIQQQYCRLLEKHSMATVTGRARREKLREALLEYYPADLLGILGCDISQPKENWLDNWTSMYHPLHHLLFIQFLCRTTQEFFAVPQHSSAPFGKGPWPCLNPLCSHYKERVIKSYTISQRKPGQSVAIFACLCGFTYSRTGPDTDDDAVFRIGRVSQFGDVWDQCLATYWLNQDLSTSQVAKLMCADFKTICHQAARLGLPFAPDIARRGRRPKIYQDYIEEQRGLYRALWEDALKAHLNAGITELVKTANKAYKWLKRHDSNWLKEHYPKVMSPSSQQERLVQLAIQMQRSSYSLIDADLAMFVRKTAEEIYARSDFPIQVTRRLLIARVGHFAILKRSIIVSNLLPLTAKALEEIVETGAAFIWRKLVWAVQSYLAEQALPSYTAFIRRAHIGRITAARPNIKHLILIAYGKLDAGTSLSKEMPEAHIEFPKRTFSWGKDTEAMAHDSLASFCTEKSVLLPDRAKSQRRKVYGEMPLLLTIIAAVVSGAENYNEIAIWGYRNEESLRWFGVPEGHLPAPKTLKGLGMKIDINNFEKILGTWLRENFSEVQNEAYEMKVHTRGVYVPGVRLLRPYQHIASAIIAKLR